MKLRQPPRPYRHPSKGRVDGGQEQTGPSPPTDGVAYEEARSRPSATDAAIGPAGTIDVFASSRIKVTIGLSIPTRGLFPEYDRMVEADVDAKVAALRIADLAFDWWAANPKTLPEATDHSHPAASAFPIETSRTMPSATFGFAKARLDPLNVHRQRAFGRILGTAVLRAWAGRQR